MGGWEGREDTLWRTCGPAGRPVRQSTKALKGTGVDGDDGSEDGLRTGEERTA